MSLSTWWKSRRTAAAQGAPADAHGVQASKRLVAVAAVLVLGAVTFDAWIYTCGFTKCPSPEAVLSHRPAEGGRVLDRRGRLIGRLQVVNRVNVPLSQVPKHVQQAFIATEDRRFYTHDGIDWRGFARSVTRNVTSLSVREGFSTISMQAARTGFLTERHALRRSIGRKLIELRLAGLLERSLSKDQILEMYVNAIYLGNGVYGVEGASRDLFGKSVSQLSVSEGAVLAAIAKGPSLYTPKRHYDRALSRRDLVIRLMQREGFLTQTAAARASRDDIRVKPADWRPAQENESYALDYVRASVETLLRNATERGGELTVHTSLDLDAQRAAERSIRNHARRIERDVGRTSWNVSARSAEEGVQGAMVAIDPRDGELRAMVGGRDHVRGAFNRALSARRQPGSAFKPFVYAAALGAGFTPATMVDDEPLSIQVGKDVWSPANYGDEYRGSVTLRTALTWSANAATVRVSRAVGERRVAAQARRNGIESDMHAVPAIALGAVEVTPIELVTAYAPFANGGARVHPHVIRKISRDDGTVLWRGTTQINEQVMDARDAFQVTSMLRSVVDEGTGRGVRSAGAYGPIAGKTGTTNNGSDVWFVGYTPTLLAGFWFGYDTPRSLGSAASGGRYAAVAWGDFYRDGWRERVRAWDPPDGMVAVDIDRQTGKRTNQWCGDGRAEWFKAGTEPTDECDRGDFHFDVNELVDNLIDQLDERELRRLTRAFRDLVTR